MSPFRRLLRVFAVAGLALQAIFLLAAIPKDCCATHHRPEVTAKAPSCHESAPAPAHCAKGAGHACAPTGQSSVAVKQPDHCRLGTACRGPLAALMTLLTGDASLPVSFSLTPDLSAAAADVPPTASPILSFTPPDPRPPRA